MLHGKSATEVLSQNFMCDYFLRRRLGSNLTDSFTQKRQVSDNSNALEDSY